MKVGALRFVLSTVAALAVSSVVLAADAEAESNVVTLTGDNFTEWTEKKGLSLVEFVAPWCGHCKKLAPEYEKAAEVLKSEDIHLGKVDCTEDQVLCEKMEVSGFPTLMIFKDGEHAAYNGTRTESGIVSYMRKQLLPPLSKLDADSFDKFTKSDRVVVVGFVEDSESDEYAVLDTLAKELRDDFTFGVVADKDLAKEQGVTSPGVVVYKQFDDGKDVFEEDITAKTLRTFIKTSSVPVLDEINGSNYAMYAQTGLPFGFAFFDSEETRKELEKQLYPVAKAHKGAINVVLIDANKFASQADHLNLEHKWPAFAIQKQANLDKFPFSQDEKITEEGIDAFVKDFIGDKLEPSYKSEPIPESNDGNVFVLVSKQFNEVVFDKSKDVLVEAYAPWCHHCRSLVPIYEKLGSILKHNKNLVISKMDAIANDVPSSESALQIYGFPTIVLVSGKNNAIVEYNGNRSLESLVEFVKENAAYDITYNKSDLEVKDEEEDEGEDEDEEDDEDEDDVDSDEQAVKKDAEEPKAEEDDEYEADTKVDSKAEAEADAEDVTDEEPKTDAAHEEL